VFRGGKAALLRGKVDFSEGIFSFSEGESDYFGCFPSGKAKK